MNIKWTSEYNYKNLEWKPFTLFCHLVINALVVLLSGSHGDRVPIRFPKQPNGVERENIGSYLHICLYVLCPLIVMFILLTPKDFWSFWKVIMSKVKTRPFYSFIYYLVSTEIPVYLAMFHATLIYFADVFAGRSSPVSPGLKLNLLMKTFLLYCVFLL